MKEIINQPDFFLYHLTLTPAYCDPLNWTDQDLQIIAGHAQFLDDLGEQGILIFAGRTDFGPGHESLFGIALIQADSLTVAKGIMSADPAVRHGIQQAEIFPFRLSIQHFKNLFAQKGG